YQICVQGRADLPLAPDEATGFSMTLLRLLAFEPARGVALPANETKPSPPRPASRGQEAGVETLPPARAAPRVVAPAPRPPARPAPAEARAPLAAVPRISLPTDPAAWPSFVAGLSLAPMATQLAAQT